MSTARRQVALRIDVDFDVGLRQAVPVFLECLRRHDMQATFFVVADRNAPGSTLNRLRHPEYRRRLRRLGWPSLLRMLGASMRTAPGFLGDPEGRRRVEQIVDEGHEVAVHGWDHGWWADHVWEAPTEALVEQVDRAFAAFAPVAGTQSLAWGAPSWRTTPAVLRHLEDRGVPYFADCWGRAPFVTLDEADQAIPVPHLPITLPSLETLMLEEGADAGRAVAQVREAVPKAGYAMLCVHDYFEGLCRPGLFEALIEALATDDTRTIALRDAADRLEEPVSGLGTSPLVRRPLPGFLGSVCWQAR